MRIVVVDDDNIIRMGLIKILERLDEKHKVIGNFQNGLLALNYLKEFGENVDLVITDIKMPIMTGIELIEAAIKQLEKPPVFIVLSGYDEFSYVRDTMKQGALNYLLKPIKKEELKNVIKEAESKLESIKINDKIINKSISILKKDFFKNILFSNKDVEKQNENILLQNMQLDENYIYKIIVIDKAVQNNISVSTFICNMCESNSGLEYSCFYYKDGIYIIFYINSKIYSNSQEIFSLIVENTDMFIENNLSVYILENTDKVWKLREQANLVKKIRENSIGSINAKKYFLDNEEKLNKIFNDTSEAANNITVIKLAKDYIINNFNKNITLKDVADEVYLSQNYLSELFKKEIGEGFYDFLSKYRIKKSKEMLITTNLKVYEIAQMVGYNDSITFGRAFKKITGTTPNNFRNNKL